ncbi:hypothetical protein PoB_004307800 [Plakobranchus ocellatus]|uniref:Ig-like domain-containing protein n=1 Tax=Plakobranchus ocellatus TaxID=259542 RepID=A0AAV4BCI3_9GAST|nr:hypothetical protein PoB_004307800 [Plakobranchus ocellatus]
MSLVIRKVLKPSEIELTLSGPDPNTLVMTCALPSSAAKSRTVDWNLRSLPPHQRRESLAVQRFEHQPYIPHGPFCHTPKLKICSQPDEG